MTSKAKRYLIGSASSAVWIFLKHHRITNKKIALPAIICHAIPLTVLASSNIPVFYDIDPSTGNPTVETVKKCLQNHSDVAAIVLPHMYGNVIENYDEILALCHERNALCIEDRAVSPGIERQGRISSADAEIFSFGKNKTIDLGKGGMLCVDEAIPVDFWQQRMRNDFESSSKKIVQYDHLFKAFFYSDCYEGRIGLLRSLNERYDDAFVYRHSWDLENRKMLELKIQSLESQRKQAMAIVKDINRQIRYGERIEAYPFAEGSHPWRFNLLVPIGDRKSLLQTMLQAGLPVNKWYPSVEALFGYEVSANAKVFSSRIINFDFMKATEAMKKRFIEIVNTYGELP